MIDPYYQHRECSAETLVCKDISRGIICGGQWGPKAQTKCAVQNAPLPHMSPHPCKTSSKPTVCLHKYVTTRLQSPRFDVSFPAKLLKIVATRGEIFSLKFTKYRLAAGLCQDPLGELKRSPGPTSRNKGAYFQGKGGKGERKGDGKE